MISYNEALKKSIEYFDGDELAAEVFLEKYALKNEKGELLEKTPEDMHRRLAKEFARIEKKYPNPLSKKEIFELFDGFKKIIPQGSLLAGVGNKYQIMSFANCYVLPPVLDSYSSILKTDQELVQIAKRRGGSGIDISNIRPKGLPTKNAAKTTDGIGVFLERFSNSLREVAQAGGRRGAGLCSIIVHHPEIETFINIKKDLKKVTGLNLSIKLTNEFMNAVKNDKLFRLRWPINSTSPKISKKIKARKIWEQIIDSNWLCGEPGILFWDTIKNWTPSDAYKTKGFETVSCNPCSEIPLSSLDSCRLLLINAKSFIKEPFTKKATFNFKEFGDTVQKAQKLLDDAVDLEIEALKRIISKIRSDPEPKEVKEIELNLWKNILNVCQGGRRTGLGLTAIGDAIAAMGLRYGDKSSIELVREIYKILAYNSYYSSVQMAKERGPFPVYEHKLEKKHPFLLRIMKLDPKLKKNWASYGRRNIANLTTSPSGTVSILARTTSGIEPLFKPTYKRRRKVNELSKSAKDSKATFTDEFGEKWQEYEVTHPGLQGWFAANEGKSFENSPYFNSTANDIDWLSGVELQAAAQHFLDHSISRTTNLPEEVDKETISKIYMHAYKSKCKGLTIYREGSRAGVLVAKDNNKKKETLLVDGTQIRNGSNIIVNHHAPKRPKELQCDIYHMTVHGEKWNMFVGLLNGKPYEIFAGLAKHVSIPKKYKKGIIVKNGSYDLHMGNGDDELVITDLSTVFENLTEAAFTRVISLSCRHGVPPQYIMEQIKKGSDKDSDLFSLGKGLARVLKEYIDDGTKPSQKKCQKCGSKDLAFLEGCVSCKSCGYGKC